MSNTVSQRGEFLRYEPCPICGSRDNVGVYQNPGGITKYCFSCNEVVNKSPKYDPSWLTKLPFVQLTFRKLTRDTCISYGVRVSGNSVVFPSVWKGEVTGVKIRDFLFPKKCRQLHTRIEGQYDKHFFGWATVFTKNIVAITCGEFDAMAVRQATNIPCISAPNGDGSLLHAIKADWELLDQFEKIYIVPDNDDSGRKHIDEATSLLGDDRCYVASLEFKDANDYLLQGQTEALKKAFWASQPASSKLFYQTSKGLIVSQSIGMPTGIEPLDQDMRGLRAQEVTYLLGAPQQGKTTFSQNLIWQLAQREVKSGLLVLEGAASTYVTKLATIFAGSNVNLMSDTSVIEEQLDKWVTISKMSGRSFNEEDFKATVRACAKAQDCKVVIIDNLTGAVDPDKLFESSSKIVLTLDELASSLGIHIVCLSHIGRGNYDEPPKLGSGFGTGMIERFAYNVLGVHRTDDLTRIELLKDRENGSVGKVFFAELEPSSQRYRFFRKKEAHAAITI